MQLIAIAQYFAHLCFMQFAHGKVKVHQMTAKQVLCGKKKCSCRPYSAVQGCKHCSFTIFKMQMASTQLLTLVGGLESFKMAILLAATQVCCKFMYVSIEKVKWP
jgi:hypothetical protein